MATVGVKGLKIIYSRNSTFMFTFTFSYSRFFTNFIIRRHRRQADMPISINATIPWFVDVFVCQVRALCSNGRRYRHDFFCIRQPVSLPGRVKIWLTSVDSFPQILPQSDPPHADFSVTHLMANCGQMVRDSTMVKVDSL